MRQMKIRPQWLQASSSLALASMVDKFGAYKEYAVTQAMAAGSASKEDSLIQQLRLGWAGTGDYVMPVIEPRQY